MQVISDGHNLRAKNSSLLEAPVRHIGNSGTRRYEPGVDIHHAPRLDLLMDRVLTALKPYQADFLGKSLGEDIGNSCKDIGWSAKQEDSSIPGCTSRGCASFSTLEQAQRACLSQEDCGGITMSGQTYELRTASQTELSSLGEHSWLRQREGCAEPATAPKVWDAFQKAVLDGLQDPALRLNASFGPPRKDDSIFISIASYRDPQCRDTVRHAFERAERPENIAVGIVQQNCVKNCMTGTGWAETRRIVPSAPDVDCLTEFCASDLGRPHCDAGRVRILRVTELEALGPFFARFLNSKLWRGETFYMQLDSHIGFRNGWDNTLVEMMKKTPSYPYSVISNYPESGMASSNQPWPKYKNGEGTPEGLCSCVFENTGNTQTIRLEHSARFFEQDKNGVAAPRHTCFVAAGFYFTHGSIVDKVPFDPLLPFIFMGEEIALSHRFWTSGYDIYGPSASVLSHEYVRKEHMKYWETVNAVFANGGIFDDLTALIIPRIQHLVGFPDVQDPEQMEPKSLLTLMQNYSTGSVRTGTAFAQACGLDYSGRAQTAPRWCESGSSPPQELFARTSTAK